MKPYFLDVIFYCYILYTTISGFYRGLISGLTDICALIAGIFAARAWGPQILPRLDFISDESWRLIAAYVIVFIAVIIIVNILAKMLEKLVKLAFLGWVNKLAGALLGFAKGLLLVSLVVLVLNILFPGSPYISSLPGLPVYGFVLEQLQQWLPDSLTRHINFALQ